MRLRFRGSCWDDGKQLESALPAPIRVPSSGGQQSSLPLRSLRCFLQSEGLEALSPCTLLSRRPPPATDLSLSCLWNLTFNKEWTANEQRQPKTEEEAQPAGSKPLRQQQTTQLPPMKLRQLLLYLKYFMLLPEIVEQDAIGGGRAAEGDKHTAARHHQDHGVQTLPVPASLACCVFVSDPDTALMPELPFPKVMLTDRSARATLFSATHTLVTTSPIRELFPSPTASSRKSIRPGHTTLAPANSVGNSRSLLELLTPRKVDAETIVSPPATEPSPEGARKQKMLQPRFEAIALDLDDEASAQLQKMTAGAATGTDIRQGERTDSTDGPQSLPENCDSNMGPSQDPATSPVLPSAWSALHLDRLLKARPMQPRRRSTTPAAATTAGSATQCTSWEASMEPLAGHIELPAERRSGQLNKRAPREAREVTSEIGSDVGPSIFRSASEVSGSLSHPADRSVGCFTRIDMEGPGDDEELQMFDASRPTKRRGLLSLLESVRCEKQTEPPGKAKFDPLATPNKQYGFDPDSLSGGEAIGAGLRTLFPERSPSIPMAVVGGGARRNGTRAIQGPAVAGSVQQRRQSSRRGSGSKVEPAGKNNEISNNNADQKMTRDQPSLAPLWAAIRKVLLCVEILVAKPIDHVRPRRLSPRPLLWEMAPRRQSLTRSGQRNALLNKNSVPGILSIRLRQREPATAVTDKLMRHILASWRKTYASPPAPSLVRTAAREQRAKAQQLQQRQHPPPSLPPATPVAPPLKQSPPLTTLPAGLAPMPHNTQRLGQNPATDSVERPQGAPAYDGSSGPPVQSRSLPDGPRSVAQDEIKQSLQGHHDGKTLDDTDKDVEGITRQTSTGLAEGGGGNEETQNVRGEGFMEATTRAKAPGNKRKLGGIVWGFGAAPDSNSNNPKRQAPPLHTTISRGSAGGPGPSTTPRSDGAVSRGELSHRIADGTRRDAIAEAMVTRGSSKGKESTIGKPEGVSVSSGPSFAAAQQHGKRARQQRGGDVGTRRRRRSNGDSENAPSAEGSSFNSESSQRRHTFDGARSEFVDAGGPVGAPVRSEDGRTAVSAPSASSGFEEDSGRPQQHEAGGLHFLQCPSGSATEARPPAGTQGNATGTPPSHLSKRGPSIPEMPGAESAKGAVPVPVVPTSGPTTSPLGTPGASSPRHQDESPTMAARRPADRGATVSDAPVLATKQHQQLDEGVAEERKRSGSGAQARAEASVLPSSVLEGRSPNGFSGGHASGSAEEGDRCQGGVQQEREEYTAMAGCESGQQRDILALILCRTTRDMFNLHSKRRRATSGGKRKPQSTSTACSGANPSRRHSDPGGRSTFGGAPSALDGAPPKANVARPNRTEPNRTKVARSPDDRPLYAVVSDDFVGRADSTVRMLSAPRAPPPPYPINTTDITTAAASDAIIAAQRLAFRSAPRGLEDPVAKGAASSASSRRGGRFHLLELAVERPVDLVVGSRSAIVILDNRDSASGATQAITGAEMRDDRTGTTATRGVSGASSSENGDWAAAAAAAESAVDEREREQQAEAEMAEAKEKLHLLQLQTLKYSTVWLLVRMDKAPRAGSIQSTPAGGGVLLRPALEKLEQWLVGFPCRVLIRYSYSEAQLAELINHTAAIEQRGAGTIDTARADCTVGGSSTAAGVFVPGSGGKRRRVSDTGSNSSRVGEIASSPRGGGGGGGGGGANAAAAAAGLRSPLEAIDERSRENPDWAALHHRQAWFLQLFPPLNAFSASAMLSCSSLKHLIVAPYEEIAPALLGRSGGGGGGGGSGVGNPSAGGAVRGGVNAECLREFCALVRLNGGQTSEEA